MADTADVLIIGAGPAGLTAALALARQQQSSIVFDEGTYRNHPADHMHLIPGFDGTKPLEYREAARSNILSNYDQINVLQTRISDAKKDDSSGIFTLTDVAGKTWNGRKLILANGVEDIFPPIEGYAECWGKAIFHCLFCKGYEQRDCSSAGVLAIGGLSKAPMALHVARQVTTLSKTVNIYTNGSEDLAKDIAAGFGTVAPMKVDTRKIQRMTLQADGAGIHLQFEDGSSTTEGFLAHTPATKPRGPFSTQLGLALRPNGDIEAGPPFYQTSVKGAYAAGDSCGMMKNIPHAIFSGSLAGMGASQQIVAENLGQTSLFG